MEKWLLLPLATKALDLLLILAAFGVLGGFLLFFIKVLKGMSKTGEAPSLELGPLKIGDRQEGGQVVVNVGDHHAEQDAAYNLLNQGYKPPKGVLPFSHHRFFKIMDDAIEGKTTTLKSRHALSKYAYLKNAAFTHFLYKCKAKTFRDMIADYVDDVLESNGDFATVASIKKRTERAMRAYEEKALTSPVQISSTEYIIQIPQLMLTKFNEWHQPHVDLTLDRLENILQSQFYSSWQLKLISILDTFEIIFQVTFDYAEYSLMDLNGDLDAALLEVLTEKKMCI